MVNLHSASNRAPGASTPFSVIRTGIGRNHVFLFGDQIPYKFASKTYPLIR
jgi:hypothetical protein